MYKTALSQKEIMIATSTFEQSRFNGMPVQKSTYSKKEKCKSKQCCQYNSYDLWIKAPIAKTKQKSWARTHDIG